MHRLHPFKPDSYGDSGCLGQRKQLLHLISGNGAKVNATKLLIRKGHLQCHRLENLFQYGVLALNVNDAGPRRVVVIGAGIVGVCVALYLQRDGRRVAIVDPGAPGEGASRGNANIIALESSVPVATPGILGKVPGMLLDPLGPLAIRWSYLPRLAPWLWRFLAASRPDRVEEISIALAGLLRLAVDAYRPLLRQPGFAAMFRNSGLLLVFEREAKFAAYRSDFELQRRRGVAIEPLGPDEIRQMEPALAHIYRHAAFYPEAWQTANAFRLVQELAEDFVRRGGRLVRAAARGFEYADGGVRRVLTDAGPEECDAAVVAAGAWSKPLARRLGDLVPLDTERGYHVMLPDPGVMPRVPVYSADAGFVATPLENGLRFAGTVELAGLASPPNYARADVLLHHGRRMFPGLGDAGMTRWMGFRPSMPDSLPVIGRASRHPNAVLAFGHGHLGLTLGAITGRLVADLLAGRDPGLDMGAFRPDRF